jgi:hypothetical protein
MFITRRRKIITDGEKWRELNPPMEGKRCNLVEGSLPIPPRGNWSARVTWEFHP